MEAPTPIELSSLPKDELINFFNSFDTVLTDCDGVLWIGNEGINGANAVINALQASGKKIIYITNNSTKVREQFAAKANSLGFQCDSNHVFASSNVAAHHVKEQGVKKAYVIGLKGISEELAKVGIESFGVGEDILKEPLDKFIASIDLEPDVGAVIVGFDPHISYPKLTKAANYLRDPKCKYIATNMDETFPSGSSLLPGAGTIVSALCTCSGRSPTLIGKPSSQFLMKAIQQIHSIDAKRTIMIGDRCNTDILFGSNCGFQTLLVLTGVHSLNDARKYAQLGDFGAVPKYYLHTLADMLPLLKSQTRYES